MKRDQKRYQIRFQKQYLEQLTQYKYFPHIIAFLIPFLTCVGICMGNGVYPFGEKCILHVDMYHQYCPFFTEFLEKLQNGGSLLYSWNLGLGSDFVSLYAYYLASPLNWFLILCPKSLVIEFMTLTILLKIAFCGWSFFYFLKEHYHLLGKDGAYHMRSVFPALVCSTAYALCGFVAAYSWDIMWMDCIALTPLIILGLEKLVKENKIALYFVTLAVAILSNYYIAIMICIFLVFYFVLLFLEQKKGRWKALGRFTICSLLAGGTAAILLIPEYIILGYSGSSGISFPETVEWYFSLIQELARTGATVYVYTGRDHWPNLYTGVFAMLLLVIYALNRRISWKEKIPRLCMIVFFWVSFANNYLDFIWHGLHFPDSLPGRQSFLYSFLLLSMSFAAIRKWKGTRVWHIVVAALMAIGLYVAGFISSDSELVDGLAFGVTVVFVGCYGILMLLSKVSRGNRRKFLRNFACVVALSELIINMAATGFYTTSRTAYTSRMADYETLIQLAEEESQGEFYRIEDNGRKTKNDDMLYGYPSCTQFSSLMNIEVSHFYQSLLMEGGKNFYCYNGATPVISSMLSVKYMLSDSGLEESPLRKLVGASGSQYLYENLYSLPLGFMMTEEQIADWDNSDTFKVNNINDLAETLGATDLMLRVADCTTDVKAGATTISVNEEGYYYASYSRCESDSLTERISDGRKRTYAKASHRYLLDLGYLDATDTVTIENTKQESIQLQVYKLNLEAVEQAYETLSAQTMELDQMSDTKIAGHIEVSQEGRLIFSIPSESGWTLYVDGEETEIEDLKDTFISVHLTEGNHTVELRYMTPGLKAGAAISAACVGLFLLYLFLRRRVNHCKNAVGYENTSEFDMKESYEATPDGKTVKELEE